MSENVFVIDTSPTLEEHIIVPQYQVGRKSTELIRHEEQSFPKTRNTINNTIQCWNCGKKTHSVRECKTEKHPIALEWNREVQMIIKDFQNRTFQKGSGRYHQTESISAYYSHLIPGVISPSLRYALGLSDGDLPPYVYRLRKHGYPKAWLKHATVKPSGINLYDTYGNKVNDPDAEDGEILEEEDKIRYDLSKLIHFPGFNAPLPQNSFDEFEKFNSPPYSKDQSLDLMIKDLQKKAVTEYCLKKSVPQKNSFINNVDNSNIDMEIESLSDSFERSDENENTSFIPPLPGNKLELPPTPSESLVFIQSNNGTQPSENKTSETTKLEVLNTISKSDLGRILSSSEGTPLLKSKSGHSRLPPPENFSKDICDVLNFENLPESTGKFERMRSLLKKVKRVLGLQRQSS